MNALGILSASGLKRAAGVVEVLGASFLAIFLILLLVLSCVGFLIGFGLSRGCFVLSFAVAAALACMITSRQFACGFRTIAVAGMVLFGIFAIFFCMSAMLYDYSYDGRTYHQMSVWMLRSGWNPIRESAGAFFSRLHPAVSFGADAFALEDLYVKGVEILEANFYLVFGSLESSKVVNLMVVFLSWLSVRLSLRGLLKADGLWCFCLSTVIALSPVTVAQLFTFYVDLHIYAGFVLAIVSAGWFIASEGNPCSALAVIASGTFLSSVKLTGLLYFGIVGLMMLVVVLHRRKRLIGKLLLVGMSCGLMCGLCSANPYLQNVAAGRHPFHPLMGADRVDIMTHNTPQFLLKRNVVAKFLISTFSHCGNGADCDGSVHHWLKPPFCKKPGEFSAMQVPDLRLGGFGFCWNVIFVMGILLAAGVLLRKDAPRRRLFLFLMATTALTVVANPHCWWARYVPQLWLIPVLPVLFLFLGRPKGNALSWGLLALMSFNCLLSAGLQILPCLRERRTRTRAFSSLLASREKVVFNVLNGDGIGAEVSYYVHMADAGIPTALVMADNDEWGRMPTDLHGLKPLCGDTYRMTTAPRDE